MRSVLTLWFLSTQFLVCIIIVAVGSSAANSDLESKLRDAIRTGEKQVVTLTDDVLLTNDLEDIACPDLTITGNCPGRKCVIDGQNKYAAFREPTKLTLQHLEIVRMRSNNPRRAPVVHANYGGADVVIDDCTIRDSVGSEARTGAVYVSESELKIEKTTFERNLGSRFGGAIFLDSFSRMTAIESVFAHNSAAIGGAVANLESSMMFVRCRFSDNSATKGGGAIALHDADGTGGTFMRTAFTNNTSAERGGAVYVGHINSVVRFCSCQFTGNQRDNIYIERMGRGSVNFCPRRPTAGITLQDEEIGALTVQDGCSACPSPGRL
ncbi:hypothetical protein CBR_g23112 [Chara braunii]|uniref:Right handed beta helix domain-containing protein n=1 Tax=Chara braunii TaxID=69332 RepID=A0A388L3S3_CHABU|nr:hypothetical protein CBR_g23112 [Chara braunii]|eukprot:GBG76898.1 hypothetical protein CBR_g23112 [Chara braunii]